MIEREAQIASEQIDVNPAQQSFLLNNQATLTSPTETLIGDTNKVAKELNDELASNPRFLAAMRDNTIPEAKNFRAIRSLLNDRNHAVLIKKYGNDYERREGLMDLDDAYDNLGVFGHVRNNWNFAREGLIMAEKQNALMEARQSGDPQRIEEALAEVQKQQEILDGTRPAETALGRGLTSFGASIADNPEAMVVGAIVSAVTGGFGAPAFVAALAGGASSAALTYSRTSELETGSAYQEIKAMYPDIPEERAASLAEDVGMINGLLEGIPMVFSGGIVGRGLSKISKPLTRAVAKAGVKKEVLQNPEFVKQFGYEIKKQTLGKWTLDTLADSSVDVAQEVIQNSITAAASRIAGGEEGSIVGLATSDIGSFLANPFAPEHEEKWNTIIETALAAPFFSAGFSAAGRAIQSGTDALAKRNQTIGDAAKQTEKGRRFAQGLFEWRRDSRAAKEAPATTRAHLETMVANKQVPDTVFIDEDMARTLAETRQDVAEKLKLYEALEKKDANGGMVEVSLLDYDEVVNTDGELFQLIKNNISFSPEALSTAAFMDRVLASEKRGGELSAAIKDKNSVYNRVLDILSRNKNMTQQERQFDASLAQLVLNRMSEMSVDNPEIETLMNQVEISMGRTNARTVGASPEQVRAQRETERELKRRIRNTDSETLATILSARGFPTRGLTGREIRAAANANVNLFTLDDNLTEMSEGQRIQTKIADIEQNKAQGDQLLLDAGMTQEQIDSLTDAEWSRLVISEFNRQNQEQGIMPQDSLIDNDALELLEWDDSLFQSTDNNIAGRFKREADKFVIRLEKMSNPTTFSHEMFHLLNTYMIEQYNAGKLTDYWKRQAEILAKECGGVVKDGKMSFSTEAMEHGADAFTNYIRKGDIPNAEMRPILAFMKHLFARVYRALGIRKVRLNKNITGVFDSIFMAQQDVEQMQRSLGLLAVEKPVGADNTLYDYYQSLVLTNRASASNKYVKTVEAFNKELASKKYTDAVETRTRELIGVLKADPHYAIKARYDALVESGEPNPMAVLQSEYMPEYSVQELEQFIALPSIEQEARTQAEAEMYEGIRNEYDLLDETLAERSIKNTDKAKALLAESVMLRGGTMADFESAWVSLNQSVDNTLATMKIDKVIDAAYWRDREAMAVERYAIFKQNGQTEKAAGERRTQAIISLIRIKSDAMRNRVNRFARHARKYQGNQDPNIMDADSYDLLQSMLKAWGYPILSRRMENLPLLTKLENWFTRQENEFMTDIGKVRPLFPEIAEGHRGRAGDMTMAQFEKLETVFEIVDKISRTEWSVQTESEKLAVQKLLDETAARIEQKHINTDSSLVGNFANPEAILRSILPQSVIDATIDPLFKAMSQSELALKGWNDRMDKAFRLVKLSAKVETVAGVQISERDLADLLLSMGTEHAYQNMCLKLGISREQAEAVASEALRSNPKYEQFMNEVWGIYNDVVEPLNESYRKTFNRVFVRKEPRAFSINGIEFKGGYVPENKNTDNLNLDQNFMPIKMGELANEKLIEKEADGNVKSIVDNMEAHLFMFARMAYVRVPYNNAQKIFGQSEFTNIVGERVANFIHDWMDNLKSPPKTDSKLIAKFSGLSSAGILGLSVARLFVQLSGIIPGIAVVGRGNFISSIGKTLKAMGTMDLLTEAKSKSDYMRARYENLSESILGWDRKMLMNGKFFDNWSQFAMYFLSYGDAAASLTVWNAAHDKAINAGRTEQQAIADADAAVRLTQSDSMIASRANGMQTQWSRILSPFMSYIMSMQSIVRGKIISKDYMDAAYIAFMYIVVSSAFESIVKEGLSVPDDDDKDQEFWDRVLARWASDAANTLGTSIVPLMGIGGSIASGAASGIEKLLTGENQNFKSFQMSTPMIQYFDNVRRIAMNSPLLFSDEQRGEAMERMLLAGVGLIGNEPKKLAKRFLAED